MNIEFESTPEYRKKHAHFYDAIQVLFDTPTAKINVNSVASQAGYSRSTLRKDRDEWNPLRRDIEIANQSQQQKPHFQVKETIKKNRELNVNVQEYKNKYLNILSAFYDLSRIVEDQKKEINYLELQNSELKSKTKELTSEIESLKSNGKVTHLVQNRKK
jgi:uncharacterized coiled-coil DUF342 family protein